MLFLVFFFFFAVLLPPAEETGARVAAELRRFFGMNGRSPRYESWRELLVTLPLLPRADPPLLARLPTA